MAVSGHGQGRASLRVVCSRGHDRARPLRIFEAQLDGIAPGVVGRPGAQQRGGQLGSAYRTTGPVANHRCPRCRLDVPVRAETLDTVLQRLADGPVPHLTVELDRLPQLLNR